MSLVHGESGALAVLAPQAMSLVDLQWWTLLERLEQKKDLPGLPAKGQTCDPKDNLTWCLLGYSPKTCTYPGGQEFNEPDHPFYSVEISNLAKICKDTLDAVTPPLVSLSVLNS